MITDTNARSEWRSRVGSNRLVGNVRRGRLEATVRNKYVDYRCGVRRGEKEGGEG